MFKLLHDGRENHTRYIPPEIADFLIDLLSDDQQSLISCSAVSRTWLPDSRHYLVQKIHIHGANVTQLINLLDSPYCALSKKKPLPKGLGCVFIYRSRVERTRDRPGKLFKFV